MTSLPFFRQKLGDWPLTAEKYASWIAGTLEKDDILNIFMTESPAQHLKNILIYLKAYRNGVESFNLEILNST